MTRNQPVLRFLSLRNTLALLIMPVLVSLCPLAVSADAPPNESLGQCSPADDCTTGNVPSAGVVDVGSLPPPSPSNDYGARQEMPLLYPAAPDKETQPAEAPEATPIPE